VSELEYVGDELDLFAKASNWKSYFASLLRPYIKGRVLEVGAGLGATTEALWNDEVESWLCLEPDPQLAAQLTERIPADRWPNARVECRVATVEELGLDERFDSILYIDVLEHIQDDRGELESVSRHLAKGGNLVVLSPAFPMLFSKFDTALGHVRRYTAKSLAAVFPALLRRERVFYADSVGAFASLANRLLLRQSMPGPAQIQTWDRGIIPVSRMLDPLTGRRFGRSVIAIYCAP
jgi:2-polyprenyl-3-methyl-5-hydroxy-6-metoxy-1,4-benzoquinol methylase